MPISVTAIFGAVHWHIPLAFVLIVIVVCIVCATVILVRNARERANVGVSSTSLDDALRDRIRRLQFGVARFALVFVYALWQTHDGPLLPRIVGASVNLLFPFALIHAIRRLQRMLKWRTAALHLSPDGTADTTHLNQKLDRKSKSSNDNFDRFADAATIPTKVVQPQL